MNNQQTLDVLRLIITHKDPLSVSDFGTSLVALENLYRNYIKEKDTEKVTRNVRLYIEHIQKGSIELIIRCVFEWVSTFADTLDKREVIKNTFKNFVPWLRMKIEDWNNGFKNIKNFIRVITSEGAIEFRDEDNMLIDIITYDDVKEIIE
jgi:hypothetical protein